MLSGLSSLHRVPAGTLTLHEADLLQDGAFDDVVRGAHLVFHTASPFFIKAESDAQKELIDPALKGTQVKCHTQHQPCTFPPRVCAADLLYRPQV